MKTATSVWFLVVASLAYAGSAHADSSPLGWPTSSKAQKPAATKSPQVLTKMTSGTKRIVSNTKNLLTPDKQPPTRKATNNVQSKATNTKQPKQGFFQSLVSPAPPPPPKTVKEWMSLKQIRP